VAVIRHGEAVQDGWQARSRDGGWRVEVIFEAAQEKLSVQFIGIWVHTRIARGGRVGQSQEAM